jgi:hypothetical protein
MGQAVGQKVGHRVTQSHWPETIAAILIPPACREEVLGDLYERNATPGQYLRDALRTVPLVIAGRIRRTSDLSLLAMYAIVLYFSFFAAAWFEVQPLVYERWGLSRLAIPWAFGLLALVLEDAYAKRGVPFVVRLLRGPIIALSAAFLSQAALWASGSHLTLPLAIVVRGGASALVWILVIRSSFQPPSKSQRGPI